MDNLTHSLTGIMLSRAGLDRFTPRAAWLLFFAANAPDLDIVSALFGADSYFRYHRGFTHAIAFAPIIAAVPLLLVLLLFRQKLPWMKAWLVSMLGICSHLLLDLTNSYAIRLFLPFSSEWLSLDITNVIDVWIWAALVIAIAAPAVSRLVASEIGGTKTKGRGWAAFALIFLLAYNGGRAVLHRRAVEVQEARLYEGQAPTRVEMQPTAVNPLLWRGFVETDTLWAIHQVNLSGEFDPGSGRILYKTKAPVIETAKRDPLFRLFGEFSQAGYWEVSPAPERESFQDVVLEDLRFGFAVKAVAAPDGTIQDAKFSF